VRFAGKKKIEPRWLDGPTKNKNQRVKTGEEKQSISRKERGNQDKSSKPGSPFLMFRGGFIGYNP